MIRNGELNRLVTRLSEAEAELQAYLKGQADAVVMSSGHTFLLQAAQKSLVQSEAAQRRLASTNAAILDALPAHIAMLHETGTIVAVNRAWRQFARDNHLPDEDCGVGRNYLEVCDPVLRAQIEGVLRGERSEFCHEYTCHSPTEHRWFRMTVTPLRHGALSGAVVAHTDISDQKLATERLQLAGHMAQLGWWSMDTEGNTVVWSDEVCDIHEVARGSTPTLQEAIAFYTPEWLPVITHHFNRCREEGIGYDVELELIAASGRRKWVRAVGEAVREESGRIRYVRGAFQDISELKAAAEENRRLAQQLVSTIETITDAFCAFDREWRYKYVNCHAERLLRRGRDTLLGKRIWDEFPETVGSALQEQMFQALETQQPANFDFFGVTLQLWFRVQVVPSEQGVGLYFSDITEARRIENELRISDERFRLLAQATTDAIWDWDLNTDEVWSSEGFYALLGIQSGVSRDGLSWRQRIHPADQARVAAALNAAMNSEQGTFSCEYRVRRGDDGFAYVLDRGHVLFDSEGRPVRMIGGMTDMTERRQVEEKLAQQASLLDKAQDAILVRDLNHEVTYWNRGAERLYGYTAAQAIGATAPQLLQMNPSDFHSALTRVLQTGDWAGELRISSHDGTERVVESRWTLVRDDSGAPRSVLEIDTDVTERKKLEQQFLRSQRLESIGTLAGGIAHDLNNVLAPITLGIQLLKAEEGDPDKLDILQSVEESVKRGADMVRQVLSFARGVDGMREPVDVSDLLAGIEKIVNDTFLKNVRVRKRIARALPPVSGDPTQLHQVLLNLCVNARDAMPGGGELTLSAHVLEFDAEAAALEPDARPGRYVQIEVNDTGAGIPEEVLYKIFEPFFTTKELGKGTGLGLSTSMAIVKSHGGFIRVSSRVGVGTSFKVYLPCADVGLSSAEEPGEPDLPHGIGQLILVVDDEPAVRQMAQKTLEVHGYTTLGASDGVEALALYASHRDGIALVLTDMMMPHLDGLATARALKKMNKDVPIIGASGLNSPTLQVEEVQYFLPKPYTAQSLLRTVKQALERVQVPSA